MMMRTVVGFVVVVALALSAGAQAQTAPATRPAWPGSTEGAVFLWHNGHFNTARITRDAKGQPLASYTPTWRGEVWLGAELRDGVEERRLRGGAGG